MKELIFIKLGGSVITDKRGRFAARGKTILRLAREIKKAKGKRRNTFFIVGHGSGSFAHIPAAKYKTKEGVVGRESIIGASLTEDAARRLNMIVVNNFLKEKLPVFSFSPASFLISDTKVSGKLYIDPIIQALKIGLMPVVYGDVVMDEKTGFTIFSTEKVFSRLISVLRKNYKIRQIYCSDVDGVYDDKGKVIPLISGKNFDSVEKLILKAKGVDVTGGMLHKIESALLVLKKYKVSTIILNGTRVGNLERALRGKKVVGTRVCGQTSNSSD